jgi:Holliday junction resolvase RusA-like endonuclease
MRKISLTVYGEPAAQGRPRFSMAGGYAKAYDPAKSRGYKDYVRLAAATEMRGQKPLEGPLALCIRVYRATPKSMSRKKAGLAETGELRPTTKPDLDNYVKGIKDALKGICWKDDGQVVAYMQPFGKYYSARPRIEVDIMPMQAKEKPLGGTQNARKENGHTLFPDA